MGTRCLVALICFVVAGACELLVAFGIGSLGTIMLLPFGLLLLCAGLVACHGHHV